MSGSARGVTVVVLAAFATVYLVGGSVLAPVVFGLQLFHVLPVPRRWHPGRWLLLATQGAVCYAAVYATGASVGILGFLGGSLLLTRAWPLAVPVAAGAALTGPLDSAISMVLMSLVIYGLTRLTERADELHAARLSLTAAAVAEERLRIAGELSDGLGRGLADITTGVRAALAKPEQAGRLLADVTRSARDCLADARRSAASYRSMSLAPEVTAARALLTTAGVPVQVRPGHTEPLGPAGALLAEVLREAVTDIVRRGAATGCLIETAAERGRIRLRVVSDGTRTAEDESLGDLPERIADAGGTVTTGLTPEGRHVVEAVLPDVAQPREQAEDRHAHVLSVALLVTVLVGFSLKTLLLVPAGQVLPAAACLAVVVALQVRSVRGRHMAALAVMALLTYLPILAFGRAWLGVAGFLAGPLPLAFRRSAAWPLVGCVTASVALIGARLGLPLAMTVNYTVSTVVTGLVVYGLLRLAQIVNELGEAQRRLARSAVVEERLRAARDLHDLLGHSLAGMLLTCELARRLPPERAPAELENVLAMAERGEADLRAASGGAGRMSLTAEAASVRAVLAAAGIEAEVSLAHDGLSAGAETALSAVLREAVTNVLRHSDARSCAISTVAADGGTRLRVRNDGARRTRGRRGSSGIGNLTARLAALDGELTVRSPGDGWFELVAWVP
ncbi:sensor histidine kinase [Streptomyces yaanensis]|uniref:Sensor histidine kinase n=1 Tax=Streptomyces yaanensis TaxID=1142239 RepID=A0ABV7SBQ2_9ACTN|nr:histidine kinase [Streptomyces sp. CGMCC 4.7035]WNB96689.1 histidine kinase [Streptomyces sp. CGMCC 4.7035]